MLLLSSVSYIWLAAEVPRAVFFIHGSLFKNVADKYSASFVRFLFSDLNMFDN